jgi:hypothetical protein
MPSNFLWGSVGTVVNLLTSELNALASGAMTVLGPAITNSTGYQMGMLHLHLASNSLAFTSSSLCNIYFLPTTTTAGATYPTFTGGTTPILARSNYLVGSISLFPGTLSAAVLDEVLTDVEMPLGIFKCVLEYVGGGAGALPATGNTLDIFPTPSQY